jgi:hypothetical protein
LLNMSEQHNQAKRGPHRWAPGQSGNPNGAPRRADALAIAIRDKVPPTKLIETATSIMDAQDAPHSVKLQAAQFLAERGYARPVERHELVVGAVEDEPDLSKLTLVELRELELLDRRRAEILATGTVPVASLTQGADSALEIADSVPGDCATEIARASDVAQLEPR